MIRFFVLITFILAALSTLGYYIWQRWRTPQKRLLSQFDKLRELILTDLKDGDRNEVERVLDTCEAHLRSLLKTRQKIETLSQMSNTVSEIQQKPPEMDLSQFENRLQSDLDDFFNELTQISAKSDLSRETALAELRDFQDKIEARRTAFLELTDQSNQ